jgi:hypothetical protein
MDQNQSGKNSLSILAGILFTLALIHTVFHFTLHGTGVTGLGKNGVSGLAINRIGFDESIKENYADVSPISSIIIIGEWSILIILAIFALVHQRIHTKKTEVRIEIKRTDSSKTDLDLLYELLQEKKILSLSTIEKVFKVDAKTVMSWCKTLESSDLARIQYPRIGEPDLVLEEKHEKEE